MRTPGEWKPEPIREGKQRASIKKTEKQNQRPAPSPPPPPKRIILEGIALVKPTKQWPLAFTQDELTLKKKPLDDYEQAEEFSAMVNAIWDLYINIPKSLALVYWKENIGWRRFFYSLWWKLKLSKDNIKKKEKDNV